MKQYTKIILSGGELKGFMILGALQYVYDNYETKNITHFVGTSIGSIISYLLCIGYTPIEIIVQVGTSGILQKFKDFDLVSLTSCNGAYNWNIVNDFLEKLTIQKIGKLITLKNLSDNYNKHIVFVTTNYSHQNTEYISVDNHPDMSCLVAIRMSCNIPILFQSFEYLKSYYLDGAISNNFPINMCGEDETLSIYCTTEKNIQPNQLNLVTYLYSLLFVPISFNVNYNLKMFKDKENLDIVCLDSSKIQYEFLYMNNIEVLDSFSHGYQTMKNIEEKSNNENKENINN